MTDLNSTAPLPAGAEAQATGTRHPATFAPATFILLLALSVFGAVIGVQLILQLGVTPNTSIIGALVAMILARVPLAIFARYRSIHVQNLAQSAISAATFGAANSLLLPIGVPFLLGRSDLILPMLVGAALSMLLEVEVRRDGYAWTQVYERGDPMGPLERGEASDDTGTTITFWPDPDVFEETEFRAATVTERLQVMAFLNRGVTITFTDERPGHKEQQTFHNDAGILATSIV